MQNLLKQIKQTFDIKNFNSYKNCINARVYSFDINETTYTITKEYNNKKLYELGYNTHSDYDTDIKVKRYMTKQDVINKIKENEVK